MRIGALIGLAGDTARPEFMRRLGPELESLGFESIWVPEHVVLFDECRSEYPYGQSAPPGDLGLLEPFVALSFLAAATTRLRLGTGIAVLPQRSPVYTAKQVADLDVLSDGRVEFGVGIGWLREEFEALGVPWRGRGARTDEYLSVLQTLWTDDVSRYDGEIVTLPPCRMYPKPVQRPHPRVHIGGESPAALRRAVTAGDGYFTMGRAVGDLPATLDRLREAAVAADRPVEDLEISVSPPPGRVDADLARRYRAAGADRIIVSFLGLDGDRLTRALHTTAERLVAPLRGETSDQSRARTTNTSIHRSATTPERSFPCPSVH